MISSIKSSSFWIKVIVTVISVIFVIWYFTTKVEWEKLLQANYTIHWDWFWLGTILAIISNLLPFLSWIIM